MKKGIIILAIFICCGCSAKYEISLIDDEITDNLTVSYARSDETSSELNEFYSDSIYALNNSFYKFIDKSTNNEVKLNFNYEFSTSNYNSAILPNSCFETFSFLSDEDKYYIFTDGAFKCNYYEYVDLDSFDVVVNTNHVVLENNADEVKNNKYIWHVDPNSDDVNIKFVVKKKTSNKFKFINKNALIAVGSITLLCFGFISLIYIRYRRLNKF